MKRIYLCAICLLAAVMSFGQAKKPTLMVVPADNWCATNHYMDTFDDQGTSVDMLLRTADRSLRGKLRSLINVLIFVMTL